MNPPMSPRLVLVPRPVLFDSQDAVSTRPSLPSCLGLFCRDILLLSWNVPLQGADKARKIKAARDTLPWGGGAVGGEGSVHPAIWRSSICQDPNDSADRGDLQRKRGPLRKWAHPFGKNSNNDKPVNCLFIDPGGYSLSELRCFVIPRNIW